MPLLVMDLIEGRGKPVTVLPDQSLAEALEKMMRHDYSQLPVTDNDSRLLGMITTDSILRALSAFGSDLESIQVTEAQVKEHRKRPTYGREDEVFDLLDELRDNYAVPIVDEENCVVGIVTSYDTSEFFRERAENMAWVEDIEVAMRTYIEAAHKTGEQWDSIVTRVLEDRRHNQRARAEAAVFDYFAQDGKDSSAIRSDWLDPILTRYFGEDRRCRKFEELDFSEYMDLLLHQSTWPQFESIFGKPKREVRALLNDVRETRNQLAHFRGDVSATQSNQLLVCRDWITQFEMAVRSIFVSAAGEPIPVDPVVDTEGAPTQEVPTPHDTELGPNQTEAETDEILAAGDSKYAPLALYLMNRPADQHEILLRFAAIEHIIRGDLPEFARQHRSWWANNSKTRTQSMQWLNAGWRVTSVDMERQIVVFSRMTEQEERYKTFFQGVAERLGHSGALRTEPLPQTGRRGVVLVRLPPQGPRVAALGAAFLPYERFAVELIVYDHTRLSRAEILESLWGRRQDIEAALDRRLRWERRERGPAATITLFTDGAITDDISELQTLQDWAAAALERFYEVVAGTVRGLIDAEQQPLALNVDG